MVFSNEPMDFMDIIQLLMPIITFAMGYFLTGIEHKRDKKIDLIREKFEKLYHPFFMLVNELGTAAEQGFSFDTEDTGVLKRFFDHFSTNIYLASSTGQQLFWETRQLYIRVCAAGADSDAGEVQKLGESINTLFTYFIQEYLQYANALGYDLGAAEVYSEYKD